MKTGGFSVEFLKDLCLNLFQFSDGFAIYFIARRAKSFLSTFKNPVLHS